MPMQCKAIDAKPCMLQLSTKDSTTSVSTWMGFGGACAAHTPAITRPRATGSSILAMLQTICVSAGGSGCVGPMQ